MARDTGRAAAPFESSGLPAFHDYDEPWTGRRVVLTFGGRPTDCGECRLVMRHPSWASRMEQATYEAAVAGSPRGAGEGALAYAARISEIVTGEEGSPFRSMPRPRQSRRETDAALERLRRQAAE